MNYRYVPKLDKEQRDALLFKLKTQFNMEESHHKLRYAILSRVIKDLYSKEHRINALSTIKGEMYFCEECNVDSTWVRETVSRFGLI